MKFKLEDAGGGKIALKTHIDGFYCTITDSHLNNIYPTTVDSSSGGYLVFCNETAVSERSKYKVVDVGFGAFAIQAFNGKYCEANPKGFSCGQRWSGAARQVFLAEDVSESPERCHSLEFDIDKTCTSGNEIHSNSCIVA